MTENEQIQEIAKIAAKSDDTCRAATIAKAIYNADYRKVKRGEWKLGKSGCMYFCPKCNYAAHPREVEEWDFCPRCGADMRKEDEGK